MKITKSFFAVFLFCVFLPVHAKPAGELWNGLDDLQKTIYVRAFKDGVQAASTPWRTAVEAVNQELSKRGQLPDTERDLPDIISEIVTPGILALTQPPSSQIIAGMDYLYKDFRNQALPFNQIYQIAALAISGESEEGIEKRLQGLRSMKKSD